MSLAGTFECTLDTSLGKKKGTLVVVPSADEETFTGVLSNSMMGEVAIENGTIDGDMLLCSMTIDKPMRMNVDCEVIIDGDKIIGEVTAGMFGSMKLTGHRIS